MDMPPPIVKQCAAADQDVLVSVKGNAEQVRLFLKDATGAYHYWVVASVDKEDGQLSVVLRGNADTPYAVVTGAVANSDYRLLGSRITFACRES